MTETKLTDNAPHRFSLLGIIGGLMVAENLGDVHDELNHLCDLIGIPRFKGGFEDGWTSGDWGAIGQYERSRDAL